jgi:hypothetical protein
MGRTGHRQRAIQGVTSEASQGVASKAGRTPGVCSSPFPLDSLYRTN